jgi:hypothetical protein
VKQQIANATHNPQDIVNAQIAQAQAAQAAANQAAGAAKTAASNAANLQNNANQADQLAAQAAQAAKLADMPNNVPPAPININVGGGSSDGGVQVVGLGGGGPVFVPQPVVVPDAPPPPVVPYGPPPGFYQPTYGPSTGASGKSSRRFTAIALGWNLDGAWVVRKNPNVDAATRDAVGQCNSQFGTCTLSDAIVTPASFGCLAVGRGNDNASRLFAAARGSMDDARSAVMDQMTSSGSAGDILYVDCNGG